MRCANRGCEHINPESAKFCNECGLPLSDPAPLLNGSSVEMDSPPATNADQEAVSGTELPPAPEGALDRLFTPPTPLSDQVYGKDYGPVYKLFGAGFLLLLLAGMIEWPGAVIFSGLQAVVRVCVSGVVAGVFAALFRKYRRGILIFFGILVVLDAAGAVGLACYQRFVLYPEMQRVLLTMPKQKTSLSTP